MNPLVRITRGGQVTLPSALRRAAGIDIGDYVEISLTDEGLVLKAKQVIDKSQAYFWTAEWQAGEREAQSEIDAGKIHRYASADAMITDLDSDE